MRVNLKAVASRLLSTKSVRLPLTLPLALPLATP